jgi:hypothetical protein
MPPLLPLRSRTMPRDGGYQGEVTDRLGTPKGISRYTRRAARSTVRAPNLLFTLPDRRRRICTGSIEFRASVQCPPLLLYGDDMEATVEYGRYELSK